MHALVLLCINQNTKFEVPSFTNSKDMMGRKIKKTGYVTKTKLIRGGAVFHRKASTSIHSTTIQNLATFSHSADMVAGV